MGRVKHGLARRGQPKAPGYDIWSGMKKRCSNPRSAMFRHYGGRGIRVCERWNDFAAFIADMGAPPLGATLERIDNDGDYTPANCRWATRAEQNRNTRQNVMLTYGGRTQCLTDWAREYGLSLGTLHARLFVHNWSLDVALTRPARSFKRSYRLLEHGGEQLPVREWERRLGVSYGTISHRLKSGWPIAKAISTPKVSP